MHTELTKFNFTRKVFTKANKDGFSVALYINKDTKEVLIGVHGTKDGYLKDRDFRRISPEQATAIATKYTSNSYKKVFLCCYSSVVSQVSKINTIVNVPTVVDAVRDTNNSIKIMDYHRY